MKELISEDPGRYFFFFRINENMFDILLKKIMYKKNA